MVKAAAADKEKDVPETDTREQQKHKGMVQLKGAAKKEKSLVLNVGGYVADEAKEFGEPKVKLGLKEAEIAGEQMSAFPKTGVGISYAAALVKGKRKELVQEGKQFGKDMNTPIRSALRLPRAGDAAPVRARGARALEGLAGAVEVVVEAVEGVGVVVVEVAGVEVSVAAVEAEEAAAVAEGAEALEAVEAAEVAEAAGAAVELVAALRRGVGPVVVRASSSASARWGY
ncbi:unnamed protein product [Closterium sp. NIES-65]|nr:unnamed protein product [Closterium sp. NIES-65]